MIQKRKRFRTLWIILLFESWLFRHAWERKHLHVSTGWKNLYCDSRHNEGQIKGPYWIPECDSGVSGGPSIGAPWCRETPVSRTTTRLIAVEKSVAILHKVYLKKCTCPLSTHCDAPEPASFCSDACVCVLFQSRRNSH